MRSSRASASAAVSIGDLLRSAAADVPERTALKLLRDPDTGMQRSWTYAQLLRKSEAVALQLLRTFKPGEHIAIWAPNRPEWLLVQFGAALAGLVLVALSPANRSHELRHALKQSDAVGVVYQRCVGDVDGGELLSSMRPDLPMLRELIDLDTWPDLGEPVAWPGPLPEVHSAQPALIQYTSGTTGIAKGAMLSHFALVNATKSSEEAIALSKGSTWLNPKPLYTSAGCVFITLMAFWNRGTQVLLEQSSVDSIVRAVAEERINWMPLPPTLAVAVMDSSAKSRCDFSSVEVVVSGGTCVAPELVKRIERELGVEVMMVMGQTEASGAVCMSTRNDTMEHRTGTIGYPLGGVEIRVCDPVTHRTLEFGQVGEICFRGPLLMSGYYNMAEATAAALDAEGWLHTGDLGLLCEDGYPQITGRLKEMIIRGGNNIYPRELEDVLSEHSSVAESAVFGIPHSTYGEVVVAAIRKRDGRSIEQQDVVDFLRERIARYKLPTHVWFVDEFPMTPSGKVQKFLLRDRFTAVLASNA